MSPLIRKNTAVRTILDLFVRMLAWAGTLLGLVILGWILAVVMNRGFAAFSWEFFSKVSSPPGVTGGGVANAILGTVVLNLAAALVAIPVGLLAGIYVSEWGRQEKFAEIIRFVTNVMIGVPSIIVGVFIWTLMVKPMKTFSGYAGAVALAVMMLPIIIRTTEDILRMAPDALREAGLSLGIPRWRVTLQIVFKAARNGLLTGVLLAVARVSGETSPLLFTALNSPYWMKSLGEPVANLPVTIFNFAMSPYRDWQQQAWGASLLIMLAILVINIITRLTLANRGKSR